MVKLGIRSIGRWDAMRAISRELCRESIDVAVNT